MVELLTRCTSMDARTTVLRTSSSAELKEGLERRCLFLGGSSFDTGSGRDFPAFKGSLLR